MFMRPFFLLRCTHIYEVWLMKTTHPYPQDKKVICCALRISTTPGASISSQSALLQRQVRLTLPECMSSFHCQETFLCPNLPSAIGRTLFTTQTASAWLVMKCRSCTSVRCGRSCALAFVHTLVSKAFHPWHRSKQAG